MAADREQSDLLNQRIMDAFQSHYDDMVEAVSVCVEKVARILYQSKKISDVTLKEASEDGWSKYKRSLTVVNAIDVYIKIGNSSSKSLEVLAILEKQPPLDAVIAKIRKQVSHDPSASGVGGELCLSMLIIDKLARAACILEL